MIAWGRPIPRCVLVWLGLLLVPLTLLLAVALPWWQRSAALDAGIATTRDQLNRYQRLVASLPALRAELAREQANDDFKAFYFDAATPALAGAQLQRDVQEMVRDAGGRPISAQVLPVDAEETPPRIRVRIQMQGTTDQLLEVLYRVEEARPFLFVDQMSIRSTTPRASPASRRMVRRSVRRPRVQQQVGQLTVRLDIFGYVLGPGQ
jgi:general secretion pathway protein M